jgi:N-acetyltransferase 10
MGYGKRALSLLASFYDGLLTGIDEPSATPAASSKPRSRLDALEPRQDLPPLLQRCADVTPEKLDWLGVSFGLTPRLFKFWKTAG